MSDLIAIGYDDETTAIEAMNEAEHLAQELIIQPDAIAAIIRNKDGKYKVMPSWRSSSGGRAPGRGGTSTSARATITRRTPRSTRI